MKWFDQHRVLEILYNLIFCFFHFQLLKILINEAFSKCNVNLWTLIQLNFINFHLKSLSKYMNVVSSANNINFPCIFNSLIEFTYMRNNRGPNSDPYGTPHKIFFKELILYPTDTICFLSIK